MRTTDCSLGRYYDPNTDMCHSCSDCGPGRSPMKFCEDQCNRGSEEDDPGVAVINQQSGVARVDHLQLSMGLSAGVLVLVIIFTAVGVILRRWHQRSRMEQLQPLNEENVNGNGNNNTEEADPYSSVGVVMSVIGSNIDSSWDPDRCRQGIRPQARMASDSDADVRLHSGCSDGSVYAALPLLSTKNDSTHCSLPIEMERFIRTDGGLHCASSAALQRHVSFSDSPPQYFEYSNDNGSAEDGCLHSRVVTQPQQNDTSYHLLPSVQVPLPLPATAGTGHCL